MLRSSTALLAAAALIGAADAFSPALPLASSTRAAATPSLCTLKATSEGPNPLASRRGALSTGAAFLGAAMLPKLAFAEEEEAEAPAKPEPKKRKGERKFNGDYQADVTALLEVMKQATNFKKGEDGMQVVVDGARSDMNEFVAFYRRNTKVAGAASFSTLYTAISTLSGHFQNYGNDYPVPAKRAKRLNQQYAEVEKAIKRGR